jgi:hypothetical protein
MARPVLPAALLVAADAAMDDVMRGEYALGVPPHAVNWRPGDDARVVRKISHGRHCYSTLSLTAFLFLGIYILENLAVIAVTFSQNDSVSPRVRQDRRAALRRPPHP